jgi:hypothetical protein
MIVADVMAVVLLIEHDTSVGSVSVSTISYRFSIKVVGSEYTVHVMLLNSKNKDFAGC